MNDLQLPINSVKFTANSQSLCISLVNGFAIFTVSPLTKKIHRTFDDQSFGDVACLLNSNMIVSSISYGSSGMPEKMFSVYEDSFGRFVFQVQSPEPIHNVFVLNKYFAYSTKGEFRVYSFDPPILYSQYKMAVCDACPCDLTENGEHYVLAVLGRDTNIIRILRSEKCEKQDISISAHSHPISTLKLNGDGTLVASASSLGTVVKLFETSTGKFIGQLRRGTLAAEIQSIAFSPNSQLVAVSSSKGTIHIFSTKKLKTSVSELRSEMKTTCTSLLAPVLSFSSNTTLHAASITGTVATFSINETNKSITCTSTESFAELIATKS